MERVEKQTAVEFIKSELKRLGILDKGKVMTKILEQAKAMEKEQIIQTYHKAALNEAAYIVAGTSHISAEQYYNETFKSE